MGEVRNRKGGKGGGEGCIVIDFGILKVWVGAVECGGLSRDEVASATRNLESPETIIIGLNSMNERTACRVAQSLVYTIEDYSIGNARARRPSLEALLYVVSARQIRDALKLLGEGATILLVASTSADSCISTVDRLVASTTGCSRIRVHSVECRTEDLEKMVEIHLDITK